MVATVAPTTTGTRLNDGDSNAGWGNYNVSGGSPASEAQNAYQGNTDVNKKVTGSGDRGGVDYLHGSTVDMSTAGRRLFVGKIYVTDYGDVNATFGVELAVGSSEGNHWEFNVAGSGAKIPLFSEYPPEGGYIIAAIAPNTSAWADASIGSPTLTAVDFFAGGADMIAGGAKAENVSLSAIDVGAGLTYTGAMTDGLADGQAEDQGTKANRWGFNRRVGGGLALIGRHACGDGSTALTGIDTGFRNWSDGYFGPGDAGLDIDLTVAAATLEFAGTYTCDGADHTEADTRGTIVVVGTAQPWLMSGTFNNWASVTLTSSVTVPGNIQAETLTQGGADLSGATIRTTSLAGQATITDPDLSLLDGARLIQAGAGHAIEITTPGSYDLLATFELYGADGTTAAAVHNNSGGLVTLNRPTGVAVPTVRNGAGASTSIPAIPVTVTFTGIPVGAEVRIYDDDADANPITLGTNREGVESSASTSYVLSHTAAEAGSVVHIQVIDSGAFEELVRSVALQATNQIVDLVLEVEENY